MRNPIKPPARILSRYQDAFAESKRMFERAKRSIPQGVNSHIRMVAPFPVYVRDADGCRKRLVDGKEVIDYWMGHASLLFGHGDPETIDASSRQLCRGTHFAAPAEVEVELAELFCELVPWADQVRFCGTGTESVALALRLARAVTGRTKFLRFSGHYHGWSDELLPGTLPDSWISWDGMLPSARSNIVVLPPNDTALVEDTLRAGDIAAILVEPTGGSGGAIPHSREFLASLRKMADAAGTILVFDEMISGFRYAPGGAAEFYDVAPHLATYGKALFGGFPGAALAGTGELMGRLGPGGSGQVVHQGTWNASPMAMASGCATLLRLKSGAVSRELAEKAESLRVVLRQALAEAEVAGRVYGESSLVHISLGDWVLPEGKLAATVEEVELIQKARMSPAGVWMRPALMLEGVDIFPFHMNALSTAHEGADIAQTGKAFRAALEALVADDVIGRKS